MVYRIYVDTNVYLDYLEERVNEYGRDLSEPAYTVFRRCIAGEFILVVSSWAMEELRKNIELQKFNMFFAFLKDHMVEVQKESEDISKAEKLIASRGIANQTHKEDALHVVLALKGNAKILITRNMSNFISFNDLVQIKIPEML